MIDILNPRMEDFARAGGLQTVTRQARCTYCPATKSSSVELAFFQPRGAGSRFATERCKCGYNLTAHDVPHVAAHCQKATGGKPAPHGAHEFDQFYCGCRGWE